MRRTILIANCHALPMTRTLGSVPGLEITERADINLLGLPKFQDFPERVAAFLRADAGEVITHRLSARFGPLATERLLPLGRVLTITNVHFTGLHPDSTYIGGFGKRLASPLGAYHSRIALYGFLKGLSVSDTARLFQGKVYGALGYFDAFRLAADDLIKRDESLDIRFAATFLELVRSAPTMYTLNHPMQVTVVEQCRGIAAHLGLPDVFFPVGYAENNLASGPWWPIYPEIAEANGLGYRTPMLFKPPTAEEGDRFLNLERFIEASFAAYTQLTREALAASAEVQAIIARFEDKVGGGAPP